MNREDAAREIDNTACCFSDKRFRDAMHMAAAALRGPQADPDTGLVRCGCGGEARLWPDGRESRTYHVVCFKCRASAYYFVNEQDAKDAWNTAMGYKEADE